MDYFQDFPVNFVDPDNIIINNNDTAKGKS